MNSTPPTDKHAVTRSLATAQPPPWKRTGQALERLLPAGRRALAVLAAFIALLASQGTAKAVVWPLPDTLSLYVPSTNGTYTFTLASTDGSSQATYNLYGDYTDSGSVQISNGGFTASMTVNTNSTDEDGNPIVISTSYGSTGSYDPNTPALTATGSDATCSLQPGFSWLTSTTPANVYDPQIQRFSQAGVIWTCVGSGTYGDVFLPASGSGCMTLYSDWFRKYPGMPGYGNPSLDTELAGAFAFGPSDRITIVDASGQIVPYGTSSAGLNSLWINGTTYYFQWLDSSANNHYASYGNGQLMLSSYGQGVTGDDGSGSTFSGPLNAGDFSYMRNSAGSLILAFGGAPAFASSAPSGEPPAVYVVSNGTSVFWPYSTTDSSGISYYTSPEYLQSGGYAAYLALPSGSPVSATLVGVYLPTNGTDPSDYISYQNGVFQTPQGSSVSVVTANADGTSLSLAGTPTSEPVALWVNGDKWRLAAMDLANYPNTYTYFGPATGQSLTISESSPDGTNLYRGISSSYYGTPQVSGTVQVTGDPASYYFVTNPASFDIRPATLDQTAPPVTTPLFGPPALLVWTSSTYTFRKSLFDGTSWWDEYVNPDDTGNIYWLGSNGNLVPANTTYEVLGVYNHGVFQDTSWLPVAAAGLTIPAPGTGHPGSLTINGEVWQRSTSSNGSTDVYLGPSGGEQLSIAGNGRVVFTDPGLSISQSLGTFSNGLLDFKNPPPSGTTITAGGSSLLASNPDANFGNLDILGNIMSLGQWQNDPQTAGFVLQFTDSASGDSPPLRSSSIGFVQARTQASWLWAHGTSDQSSVLPMMELDSLHRLQLFDPASSGTTPSVWLDPSSTGSSQLGSTTVNGVLVINQPAGGIGMGEFTSHGN